jgi:hypothetical protein
VGAAQTANGAWHACLWSGGKVIDLVEPGDLGGDGTIATAINDQGVIVGNGQWFKVFVKYPGEKMQDLPPMVKTALFDPVFGIYQKDDYVDEAHDINNSGVILARIYHPNYSGLGVAYSATLWPGAVTPTVSGGELKITAGAPPGFEMQVDRSADFKEWSSVGSASAESGLAHSEPVQNGSEFFRIVVKPQE